MNEKKAHVIQKELKALEDIASWFDTTNDFDVEEGLEKVKEGAVLVQSLRQHLKRVENEFRELERELVVDEDLEKK